VPEYTWLPGSHGPHGTTDGRMFAITGTVNIRQSEWLDATLDSFSTVSKLKLKLKLKIKLKGPIAEILPRTVSLKPQMLP
jgi:hypothetical protein